MNKNHYIYRITSNHPKFLGYEYIGMRSCKCDIDSDKYYGGGVMLNRVAGKIGRGYFTKEILFVGFSRSAISWAESVLVDEGYVNRKDTFNCITGGQDGDRCGAKMSAETLEKMTASHRTDEARAKTSETHRELWSGDSYREKMILAREGMYTDAFKSKISESIKDKYNDPAYKQRVMDASRKGMDTDESRQKSSDAMSKRWKDSEFREFRSESQKRVMSDPAMRERLSKKAKEQFADQGMRDAQRDRMAKQRENPAFLKSLSDASKGANPYYVIADRVVKRLPVTEGREAVKNGLAWHINSKSYKEFKRASCGG